MRHIISWKEMPTDIAITSEGFGAFMEDDVASAGEFRDATISV